MTPTTEAKTTCFLRHLLNPKTTFIVGRREYNLTNCLLKLYNLWFNILLLLILKFIIFEHVYIIIFGLTFGIFKTKYTVPEYYFLSTKDEKGLVVSKRRIVHQVRGDSSVV
jgi:hypothetical protein